MDKYQPSTLAARITNCLQTILELEPVLHRIDAGHILLPEFGVLKAFLNDMDTTSLDEDDVTRIESATERFLKELKTPVTLVTPEPATTILFQ